MEARPRWISVELETIYFHWEPHCCWSGPWFQSLWTQHAFFWGVQWYQIPIINPGKAQYLASTYIHSIAPWRCWWWWWCWQRRRRWSCGCCFCCCRRRHYSLLVVTVHPPVLLLNRPFSLLILLVYSPVLSFVPPDLLMFVDSSKDTLSIPKS